MAEKFNIGDYFRNDNGEIDLDISKDGNFSDYLTGLLYKQGELINNNPGGIMKNKNMSNYKTSKDQNKSLVSKFGGKLPKPRDISLPFNLTVQDLLNFKDAPIETVANSSFAKSLASGYDDVKGTTSQVIENIKNSDYMKDSKEVAQNRKNKQTMNTAPPGEGDATVTLSDMIMSDGVIDLLNTKPFEKGKYKGPMEIFGNELTYDQDGGIVPLYKASEGGRGDGNKETQKRKTDPDSPQNKKKEDSKKKETTEKKTEEKEQGLMSKIMNGLMSNPEFGLTVAESLMSGGGLMPGITKGARAQTAVNAAKAQAEIDNLLKKSQMDKNNMGPDEILIADSYARRFGEPGSREYEAKFTQAIELQITKEDNGLSMTDAIKGGAFSADPNKMLDIINEKLNKSSTTSKATPTNAYDLVGYSD